MTEIIITLCIAAPLVGVGLYIASQCDAIAASRRDIDAAINKAYPDA